VPGNAHSRLESNYVEVSDGKNVMMVQKEISLEPRARGFHLITHDIIRHLPEMQEIQVGLLNVFIQHTSAALTINENADPSVRVDFESFFNRMAAENEAYYTHTDEGADDMPAHLKASILGCTLTIPVTHGQLNMGIWQGIYLCEHRNHGGQRRLVLTLSGE